MPPALGGIDLLNRSQPVPHVAGELKSEFLGTIEDNPNRLIEAEEVASLAVRGEMGRALQGKRRLASTRLP